MKVESKDTVNKTAIFNLSDLKGCVHTVIAEYEDSTGNVNASSTYAIFTIYKQTPDMNAIVDVNGFDATIIADLNTDGIIKIYLDGKEYTTGVTSEGFIEIPINNLPSGNYSVEVVFMGNDWYNETSFNLTFTIEKKASTITLKTDVMDENVNVTATTNVDGIVDFYVNGVLKQSITTTNKVAVLRLKDLEDGNYTVKAVFRDTKGYYNSSEANATFHIEAAKLVIKLDPIVMYTRNGTRLNILVTDSKGKPLEGIELYITLNGANYFGVSNKEGVICKDGDLSIIGFGLNGLRDGFYDVTATFKGNKVYDPVTVKSNITVLTTVSGDNLTKYFGNGSQFFAKFVDFHGNPLASGTQVQYNINGVMYYRNIDSSLGKGPGVARMNVNLRPGTYVLTATNPVTGYATSFVITVLQNIFGSDLTKYYKNGTQFYVKLLDAHGNPAPHGTKVSFNINGVFYDRYVNSSLGLEPGVARMNINLWPGTYISTAYYGDNPQNTFGFTINVLPTIITKDVSMTTSKRVPFTATILKKDGSRVGAGILVQFNINGVLYDRYTNAQGIASLNINLRAGVYSITTKCTYQPGPDGLGMGDKVTIRNG